MKGMLEELEKTDPETWQKWVSMVTLCYQGWFDDKVDWDGPISMYILQGELQRAIEKRGWYQEICGIECEGYKWQVAIQIGSDQLYESVWASSPASALLATYLAARRTEG